VLGYGDALDLAHHVAAVAITQPAKFGQKDAAVGLVQLDLLGLGITETVRPAFFLELREAGALGEEVAVGSLQILERLLQRMHRRIRQPRRICAVAPRGEQLAQARIA
jgi:hypothetical protein